MHFAIYKSYNYELETRRRKADKSNSDKNTKRPHTYHWHKKKNSILYWKSPNPSPFFQAECLAFILWFSPLQRIQGYPSLSLLIIHVLIQAWRHRSIRRCRPMPPESRRERKWLYNILVTKIRVGKNGCAARFVTAVLWAAFCGFILHWS